MIGAVGIMLIALAISARDDFNKIFAHVIALVFLIVAILSIIGMVDNTEDTWNLVNGLFGISYIIISIWSITHGSNTKCA
jgi:heme/copper-type cytochrome/quinol oxidase subunit 4